MAGLVEQWNAMSAIPYKAAAAATAALQVFNPLIIAIAVAQKGYFWSPFLISQPISYQIPTNYGLCRAVVIEESEGSLVGSPPLEFEVS